MNNIIIKDSNQIISLSLLKSHLRIAHDHEDDYLKSIIKMATDVLEKILEKSLLTKTFCYKSYNKTFTLPIQNVQEIISVNNNSKALDFNFCCPKITIAEPQNVEIIYTAGMSNDINQIPDGLKLAVLQIAKSIYECEDFMNSKYINDLIRPYKSITI